MARPFPEESSRVITTSAITMVPLQVSSQAPTANPIRLNKFRGMLMGVFLGDTLGAPHEFYCNRNSQYTGLLSTAPQAFCHTRAGTKYLAKGQVTDDSEMTITLLRSLIANRGYQEDAVVQAYMDWANSGLWMLGHNTRALFHKVTTIKGYRNRMDKKVLALPVSERSQSNGALMRCSPLVLLNDNDPVIKDVNLSNPHPTVIYCNVIYLSILRWALKGYDKQTIYEGLKPQIESFRAFSPELALVYDNARQPRDTTSQKGWILHAFWWALQVLVDPEITTFQTLMKKIIAQVGCDSDTNGAIAGAVLGALLGFEELEKQEGQNILFLLQVDLSTSPTPRQIQYQPHDFFALTEQAVAMFP